MGRWILTLFASLLAALPFFRRRRAKDAAASDRPPRPPLLPPAEAEKLAPLWRGFGERAALLFAPAGEADDDAAAEAAPVAAAAVEAATTSGPTSAFARWSTATPWILAVGAVVGLCLPADSGARPFVVLGSASGLVGYWTNWLAIRLLFKPTRPRFGFGVIPANRAALVRRLADAVESRLVNPAALAAWLRERGVVRETLERWHAAAARVLGSPEFREDLKERLAATGRLYVSDDAFRRAATEKLVGAVRELLRQKVWSWAADLVEAPLLERVKIELAAGLRAHGGEMIASVLARLDAALDALAERLREALPEIEEAASERITAGLRKLDVRGLVASKLRELDDGELEAMIRTAVRNELAAVEVLGGALGLLAGLLTPFLL